MPIIGSVFFSVETLLLFNSVLNYLPDAYPEYAASVLAGNDFMRSSFGAGFPLFALAMYRRLGVGWASSKLAFLGIAFIPILFALYYVSRPHAAVAPGLFVARRKANLIDVVRRKAAEEEQVRTTGSLGRFGPWADMLAPLPGNRTGRCLRIVNR